MAAILHQLDQRRLIDTNGIADGASIYFYTTGTLTPAPVYTTAALSVEHSSPIVVAAGAAVPDIWLDSAVTYRRRIVYPDGSVDDTDPYTSGVLQATDLASTASGKGAALVGYSAGGIGAIDDSVLNVLRMGAVNVMSFIPISERAAITAGTSTTDVTTYLQAALDAHIRVVFPDGLFKITDQLEPRAGQTVIMSPGTTIRQYTANTPIFYAQQKDDLTFDCNGAVLYGEGSWSGAWTGNGGHNDKGIWLDDCDRAKIIRPYIKNCALAGITLWGGQDCKIIMPVIEGTHTHGVPLSSGDNFQMGIYLHCNTPYGAPDGLIVLAPDISGVAQGVLVELPSTGSQPTKGIQVVSPLIHDIPGQHAFYFQTGEINVTNPMLRNIALAGFKIQSTVDNNQALKNIVCTGVNAKTLGSNMFEVSHVSGSGSISNLELSGVGEDVLVGLGTAGDVSRLEARLKLKGCGASFMTMSGDGAADFDVMIVGDDCAEDGIVVSATNTANIRIRPNLQNVRSGGTDADAAGVFVGSATANVELFNPVISGSGTNMKYAVANSTAGGVVTIHGERKFSGAATADILRTGTVYDSEWTSWTPTIAASSGALTTTTINSARFKLEGKRVLVDVDFTLTNAGTGSGTLTATLPLTAAYASALSAMENASTGAVMAAGIRPADLTKMYIAQWDNGGSIVATGRRYLVSGVYERV